MELFAIYLRVPADELARIAAHPPMILQMPLSDALEEGRALDLGRAWEELGCLLEGGIRIPEAGPTVGDQPLVMTDDGVAWNQIPAARVAEYAQGIMSLPKPQFVALCTVDEADTADFLPGERTGQWGDPTKYLFQKYKALSSLYRRAAANGEAILVRLGPQRRQRTR